MVRLTNAELCAASAAQLESLYALLRGPLDDARAALERLHWACRHRELSSARESMARLQRAWSKTLTTIAAIEGLRGQHDQAARKLLEESEREAARLFARVEELTAARAAATTTQQQP